VVKPPQAGIRLGSCPRLSHPHHGPHLSSALAFARATATLRTTATGERPGLMREYVRPGLLRRRVPRQSSQYLSPTNSSSRATASRRATEMTFGREKRHTTPSRSSASPHNRRMSLDSLLN
jgi:hypothetical protein